MPQKKRARRRLVGAAALCLAAAIALPLLFDAEPRQRPAEVQVDIPSRDTPLPARGTDPSSASATLPPGVGPSRADEAARGEPPVAVPPEPVVPAMPPPAAPAASAKSDPRAAATRPGDKPAAERGGERPGDKSTPPAAARAPGDKPAGDKQAKASPSAENKRYVLQIGAFASERGANEQADKVKAAGLAAFTEKISTSQGDRIRVRVGPFPTREQAEAARGQLKLVGIDSALIAP